MGQRRTWKEGFCAMPASAGICPVSHLKRSGLSTSSTSENACSAGKLMFGRCFCAQSPTCKQQHIGQH